MGAATLDAMGIPGEATEALDDIRTNGIVLDGHTWRLVTAPTFEHQHLRVKAVQRAGVAALFPAYDVIDGDADALAATVIDVAFTNGALFDLLAHMLIEDGAAWSPAIARANALRLAALTDSADHGTLTQNILFILLDFFLSLAVSTPILLRSLIPRGEAGAAPSRRNTRPPAASAVTSTLDRGTMSSVPSPDSGEWKDSPCIDP